MNKLTRTARLSMVLIIVLFLMGGPGIAVAKKMEPQRPEKKRDLAEIVKPTTQWEKVAAVEGFFIEGINFDHQGRIWLVDVVTGRVIRVENGKGITVGSPYKMPNGAKFNKEGQLIITDRMGELYTFDTTTGKRTPLIEMFGPEHLRGTNDLIFDSQGGIYFTEPYGSDATKPTGRVFYLPPGEKSQAQFFVGHMAYPNGIALSPDGKTVYIAEFGRKQIISAPAVGSMGPGSPYVFARVTGGIGPDGLAIDVEGNVYAALMGAGEVWVFNPGGQNLGVIRLPQSAGQFSSSIEIHDGHLYVVESQKAEVWRIKIEKEGLTLFGDQ